MTKRRFSTLLPAINQTEVLTKFFGATVDQLFQPGTAEPISGYIGNYPSYYDAAKDFYLAEPTVARTLYQLEAGMVAQDTAALRALTYPDFLAYLQASGGIINSQDRLFDTEFYTWAPPIDIDKLLNPTQYYWFGNDTVTGSAQDDLDRITLTVSSPLLTATGDGATTSFALPAPITGITPGQETPSAYVNGIKATATLSQDGNSLVLASAPASGAQVVTTRLDDLSAAISGQKSFPLTGLVSRAATYYGDGYSTSFDTAGAVGGNASLVLAYVAGAPVPATLDPTGLIATLGVVASAGSATTTPDVVEIVTLSGAHSLSHDGDAALPSGVAVNPVTALSSGMRVRLLDTQSLFAGWDMAPWDAQTWDTPRTGTYFVDGVGQSIRLTDDTTMKRGLAAQFVTIDRSSINRNAWSVRNHWIHQDSYAWSGLVFENRKANRPIIEFVRDISLWQYGLERLDAIEAALTTRSASLRDGTAISVAAITGQSLGNVIVDGNVTLVEGMRLLVAQAASDAPSLNQTLYRVDVQMVGAAPTLLLTPLPCPASAVAEIMALSGFGPAGTEIRLDNGVWTAAQPWDESVDPLFTLYDVDPLPTPLNDPSRYPGSTFAGNRIFGFATGTGATDSVLKRALAYDANGYIQFETDAATRTDSSNLGPITGLYCYGTDNGSGVIVSPLWHKAAGTTADAQPITTEHAVPLNLSANPLSETVTLISKSDWTDHFASLIGNQAGLSGGVYGSNTYRDSARDLSLGTQILQHRSTLLRAMLLASDTGFDFFSAVRYGEQEYTRFRNKFIRKLVDLRERGTVLDGSPVDTWIDTALAELKSDKSSSFPFALSAMGGRYDFIPPTPCFLGVLAPATPMQVVDTTFPQPVNMLRGHDGSLTPRFNDWRDAILLGLEQRLYAGVDASFKGEARRPFDLAYFCNGRFWRSPLGYNMFEVAHMLAPHFERWAIQNRLDYHTNAGYSEIDPFTWNYNGVADAQGTPMPGHWRAIYRYYFDTDRPHACPWEMLGFAEQPTWWVAQYGTAWGRNNTALWADLEAGCIRQGERATATDPRYARPGLAQFIPVDASGMLLDPIRCHIIPQAPTYQQATRPWVVMDGSPAEALWRNSPSFRFALAQLGFLMKPARMTDLLWDALNTGYLGNQWVDLRTFERPSPRNAYLTHGETDPTTQTRKVVVGIQQWIADSLLYAGVSLDGAGSFGAASRALDVRLIHPMAGFVSADGIKSVADNFGLVPSEDMEVVLYQSPTKRADVYSGVIVEWTGQGYRVVGYDQRDPHFTCIPPNTQGPKGVISLATTPERPTSPWRPHSYYAFDTQVEYKNVIFKCLKSHTSGITFEDAYWQNLGAAAATRAPRVVTYLLGLNNLRERVPYGTEFSTLQQVADFLLGYERYLKSRGWTFNVLDSANNLVRDWSVAVRDLLQWSQVNWAPGNFIALSPGAEELHYVSPTGTVLNVEDAHTGFFGLTDRAGQPIGASQAGISRLDGDVTLTAANADIFGARVRVVEIEHALIFSNTTIFNDVIFAPLFNLRQARLRLIGKRARDWVGRLEAPGYMVSGATLLPNFAKTPEDLRLAFDIERSDNSNFRDYARHQIGYQARDYMQALLLSETEQFEFYQGMIQAKGSPGVFDRLLRSQRINADSNIVFLEEWAIRLSRFGAPVEPRATMLLPQSGIRRDPQVIRFVATPGGSADWTVMTPDNALWLDAPKTSAFFPDADPSQTLAMPSAGPVRLTEVQYTAFAPDNLAAYFALEAGLGVQTLLSRERVWLYDVNQSWNVWRVCELDATGTDTPNAVTVIASYAEDTSVTGMRLSFAHAHGLTQADIGASVIIDATTGTSPDLLGVQTISQVDVAHNWIEVSVYGDQGNDFTASSAPKPSVRILRSVRFANHDALAASPIAWRDGDLVWLDSGNTAGRWSVLRFSAGAFLPWRDQPNRTDISAIAESMVYSNGATLGSTTLTANPPLIDDLVLIDPLLGALPGIAMREIDFRLDYDPATYNAGSGSVGADPWAEHHVGRVWWNMATVRFLDPYTDRLGLSDARDVAEIEHRARAWAQIAPNTSVDVYEWVESAVSPAQWTTLSVNDTTGTYDGVVYNAGAPAWVERTVFDPALGTERTAYYFWVSARKSVPHVPFRNSPISTVASVLTNPTALALPWIAPIAPDTLLVSGVAPFLNETTSALKVELRNPAAPEQGMSDRWSPDHGHDEWLLLRSGDERSLPPAWLWRKLRDSLAGFDATTAPVPSSTLHPTRATGIQAGQSMFVTANTASARGGLLDARQSFVAKVNDIFATASSPILSDRLAEIGALLKADTCERFLFETATTGQVMPPDPSLYDYRVTNAAERNALLASPAFALALANGTTLRVMIDGIANTVSQWSIWAFNPARATAVIAAHPYLDATSAMLSYPDQVFELATAYDFKVATRYDRDLLLSQDFYQHGYTAASKLGAPVYADAIARDAAEGTPPAHKVAVLRARVGAPETLTAYDSVLGWTIVGQTGPILPGTRVLVDLDEAASHFWTLWTYAPHDPAADAQGFVLDRVQRYRTSDFFAGQPLASSPLAINVVDWYAQNVTIEGTTLSFGPANPPMVSYPNMLALYAKEGDTPTNLFVQINDPNQADQPWSWVAHDPSLSPPWRTVALQGGSLALSPHFYDPTRPVHGVGDASIADIATRDGSWELRILADLLLSSGVLLDSEINDLLFSMIHFVHAQQDDIDWVFKTSFMTIAGYAVPLTQTAIQTVDVTDSLIEYINEVKPYRVKVRDYTTQYSAGQETVDSHVTDFDKPVWYDPQLLAYRVLDPTKPADLAILTTTRPWSDWYANHGLAKSPVRQINITLKFDRVSADPTDGYDGPAFGDAGFDGAEDALGTAADRLASAYNAIDPLTGKDLNAILAYSYGAADLMNLRFKGSTYQGKSLATLSDPASDFDTVAYDTVGFDTQVLVPQIEVDLTGAQPGDAVIGVNLNTATSDADRNETETRSLTLPNGDVVQLPLGGVADPLGYGLRDAYAGANHPEERVSIITDDALTLHVRAGALAGAPPQATVAFDTSNLTLSQQTFFFGEIAQSAEAVLVWRDGVRAVLGTDYTVDHLGRSATVNLLAGNTRVNTVAIHAFGFGGTSIIRERHLLAATGAAGYTLNAAADVAQIEAVVDGVRLDPSMLSVTGTTLTITPPPAFGADLVLIVWDGGAETACRLHSEVLPYTSTKRWTIQNPDQQSYPDHAGTLVEVDGVRLLPPPTYYGRFDKHTRALRLDVAASANNRIAVYVNGALYPHAVPFVQAGSSPLPWGAEAIGASSIEQNADGMFAFLGAQLVSLDPGFEADEVCVTVYAMHEFDMNRDGTLTVLVPLTPANTVRVTTFSHAGLLGLRTQTFLANADGAYPAIALDDASYGLVSYDGKLVAPELGYGWSGDHDTEQSDYDLGGRWVIATSMNGTPARGAIGFRQATATPASLRMAPIADDGGFGVVPFELEAFDRANDFVLTIPRYGKREDAYGAIQGVAAWQMDRTWEYAGQSGAIRGILLSDLLPADPVISISILPLLLNPKLTQSGNNAMPALPFAVPDPATNKPGVIWVGGERIEYFDLVQTGTIVTLGRLRRGTRGTSVSQEARVLTRATADGTTTSFTLAAVGGQTEVLVDGVVKGVFSRDYSLSSANGVTTVTFASAPKSGAFVVLAMTTGARQKLGSAVFDAQHPISAVPVGPDAGDIRRDPIRMLNVLS